MLHVCDTLYSVAQRLACARLSVSADKQKKQTRREKQATKNDGKRDGESLQASFRIPQSAHYSVPWPLPEKNILYRLHFSIFLQLPCCFLATFLDMLCKTDIILFVR